MQSEVCSLEARQLALKKALGSHTFARSEQLKAFLRYICEAEMQRPGAPLTEYVIGVEVLGRPEGYSPAEDSSVRTRAYELRQKLERLYTRELTDEAIQIAVPKGTYAPHFIHRPLRHLEELATISLPAQSVSSVQKGALKPASRSLRLVIAGLVIVAVFAAVTWRTERAGRSEKSESDPVLTEAWGPLSAHDGTVIMCLATPLSMVVGPRGHDVFGSKDYPAPEEAYPIFKEHRSLAPGQQLGLTFSDNMVAIGVLNAALVAEKTLRNFGTSYQILPERVATISALRGRNVMLFGAPIDSEAVNRELADMPLSVDFEPSVSEFVVRDKTSGSFVVPKKAPNGDLTEVYGLLTVKSVKDNDRHRIQSVIFSGITSAGAQGASEYFSSPSAMSNLRELFVKEGVEGFPASYQVTVRCTYTNQLLLAADYFSHRTVKKTL